MPCPTGRGQHEDYKLRLSNFFKNLKDKGTNQMKLVLAQSSIFRKSLKDVTRFADQRRKRTDKRDNFVKLNRDHRQQFPHYIRATPATLTITNWQAISSSSSPLPLSWVSATPSAPGLLSSSEPPPLLFTNTNIFFAEKLVPVHVHQRLGTHGKTPVVSELVPDHWLCQI